MKRKASIISNSINTNKLFYAFKKSNYILENIYDEDIEFNKLKESDSIFIDNNLDKNLLSKIERFCLDNNIEFNIYANSISFRKSKIKAIDDLCFLKLSPYKISRFNSFIKRLFDIVFSIIFIILSLPVFIILIIVIKLFDNGPVFYLQKRLTKDEKEFIIYKFRTMKVNAEKETGAILSPINDVRLTSLGRILRKFKLDEIPQIFNVLLGDMSVVGPRPERKHFTNKYKRINEYYKYRFNVKAGITGYAQVYGKYDSSYKDKLDYDLYYISNYSFLSDLSIIFKTVMQLFVKNKVINKKKKTEKEYLEQ